MIKIQLTAAVVLPNGGGDSFYFIQQKNVFFAKADNIFRLEHDMDVIAASDWVVDIGPGAGEEGGLIVAEGIPANIIKNKKSRTAPYLAKHL